MRKHRREKWWQRRSILCSPVNKLRALLTDDFHDIATHNSIIYIIALNLQLILSNIRCDLFGRERKWMPNTLFESNAHFGVRIDPPGRCRSTIMLQRAFSKNFEWKLQQKLWMRSFSIIMNIALKLKVKQANKGILTCIKGSIQLTHRHNSWNWVLGVAHKPSNELNVLSFTMQKMFWALEHAHTKKIIKKANCVLLRCWLYVFFSSFIHLITDVTTLFHTLTHIRMLRILWNYIFFFNTCFWCKLFVSSIHTHTLTHSRIQSKNKTK